MLIFRNRSHTCSSRSSFAFLVLLFLANGLFLFFFYLFVNNQLDFVWVVLPLAAMCFLVAPINAVSLSNVSSETNAHDTHDKIIFIMQTLSTLLLGVESVESILLGLFVDQYLTLFPLSVTLFVRSVALISF